MSLPSFTFVSGNSGKVREVERILGQRPSSTAIDLPEIQALDLETILRAKGDEAWRRLGRPLVVDETGLSLAALGGFPGPLVKWMLQAMGAAGIGRLAESMGNTQATAHCGLLYRDAEGEVVAFGEVVGHLLPEPRGSGGFGWDPIFVPGGQGQTYAELSAESKDRIGHRGQAWRALLVQLGERRDSSPPR